MQPLNFSRYTISDLLEACYDSSRIRTGMVVATVHPMVNRDSPEDMGLRVAAEEIGRRVLAGRAAANSPLQCVQAALTTADFGDMLGNLTRAVVKQSLASNLDHRALAQPIELVDYKPASVGGLLPDEMTERNEDGEFLVTSLTSSGGGTIQLKHWGRILSITPEVILNDDVKLISLAAKQMAASIGRVETRELIGALAENPTLQDGAPTFESAFGNDVSTASVFSITGFGVGVAALRQQKATPSSDPLNLPPRFLLCHPANEIAARTLLWDTHLPDVEVFPHSSIGATEAIWLTSPDQMAVLGLAHEKNSNGQPSVNSARRFETGGQGQRITHRFGASVLGRVGTVRVKPA
jgi:hypothetical protein